MFYVINKNEIGCLVDIQSSEMCFVQYYCTMAVSIIVVYRLFSSDQAGAAVEVQSLRLRFCDYSSTALSMPQGSYTIITMSLNKISHHFISLDFCQKANVSYQSN